MWLRKVTFPAALDVALRMREWDQREIFACRWNDNPADLARDCTAFPDFCWVAGEERPIAVIGAQPMRPGVWCVFMFATDDFLKIRFSMTRFVKRVMVPALVQSGAHRAECHSMEGHTEAQAWLQALGAVRECTLVGYGRNGENFASFVWNRPICATRESGKTTAPK